MNLSVYAVIGMCVIALALIVLLRQYRPEFALLVSVITAVLLLIYGLFKSSEIIEYVRTLSDRSGIDENNLSLMLKALGICYLTQIAKDVCTDCGQSALADRVDFIGKITIVALSLPLLIQITSLITNLIQ